MNWILSVFGDYLAAVVRYWWLVVPGVLMPLPDIYKALHPTGRQLKIPRPLRIAIFVVVLLLAQFLAYRDSIKNLSKVIEEKRELSIQLNAATDRLHEREVELASVKQQRDNLAPFKEPEDSLRRRTIKLSNEIDHWVEEQWANRPPVAYLDPKNPNPSIDQEKAIETWSKWDQDRYNYFRDHFKDQWVRIVKEYDAKGVKVGSLINDAEQSHPVQRISFPFPPVSEDLDVYAGSNKVP